MGGFLSQAALGGAGVPFPIVIADWIGLALLATWWLEANLGSHGNDLHKLALVVGLQSMFIAWEIGLELTNPWARGITVTGALYFGFLLVWLRRRLLRGGIPLLTPAEEVTSAPVEVLVPGAGAGAPKWPP